MADAKLAFIGGSGLYDIEGLADRQEIEIDTPFGSPSDHVVVGTLNQQNVAFLPRHGRGHRLSPTEIPVKANLYALKSLGVERVVSISAVGSLNQRIQPLDVLVPDQLIDRTKSRDSTYFGNGIVAHIGFADPFCRQLRADLLKVAEQAGARVHDGGTYVVMEGPAFSTRAESELYRSWNASVIGMTALPEAKLAREAEMCYATLALVTDYDCWHESEETVTVDIVVANLMKNVGQSKQIVRDLAAMPSGQGGCDCQNALKDAIITSRDIIPDQAIQKLGPIVSKYL